jgi:methylase of polypeptide subunit release factors
VVNEPARIHFSKRYETVTRQKSGGATYTPEVLADFVARAVVEAATALDKEVVRVLDPAVGDGELLVSILRELNDQRKIEVYGFDTDQEVLDKAKSRISQIHPCVEIKFQHRNFLDFALDCLEGANRSSFCLGDPTPKRFDLIIANPPYVRTQIMGTRQAQLLARQFNLNGRIDLYYAFLIAISSVLEPTGFAGIIVSNRFMTTKSGARVRALLRENFHLKQVWDLGDTKLFSAAVLPAVLLVQGKENLDDNLPGFTSIYETTAIADKQANHLIDALSMEGVIGLPNGQRFKVQQGNLNTSTDLHDVWRISTTMGDDWLATVDTNTWGRFCDIGKIRVGVKTCADKVFIRSDWESFPADKRPELLRPVTTHHMARRFRALPNGKRRHIVYTHEVKNGQRRAVDLNNYPRTRAYFEQHKSVLESRKYVLEAGREWFEIWVPQDPTLWCKPKLVFRDISDEPVFWLDQDGTIVNGDCYWLTVNQSGMEDLLWLAAAVANSSFATVFYDYRFHNKLYSSRRRFITQYVEQFPLPQPDSAIGCRIIDIAKTIYDMVGTPEVAHWEGVLDTLVWQAFGVLPEKVIW